MSEENQEPAGDNMEAGQKKAKRAPDVWKDSDRISPENLSGRVFPTIWCPLRFLWPASMLSPAGS